MIFGKDFQKNPLHWLIVAESGDICVLLAERAVAAKPFHDRFGVVYWEECSLRHWLMHDFFSSVLSTDEQKCVTEIDIPTISQLLMWFPVQADRKCYASKQALANGIVLFPESGNSCTYWLQDTGRREGMSATVILPNGGIYQSAYMMADNVGVRPYLKLRKKLT